MVGLDRELSTVVLDIKVISNLGTVVGRGRFSVIGFVMKNTVLCVKIYINK